MVQPPIPIVAVVRLLPHRIRLLRHVVIGVVLIRRRPRLRIRRTHQVRVAPLVTPRLRVTPVRIRPRHRHPNQLIVPVVRVIRVIRSPRRIRLRHLRQIPKRIRRKCLRLPRRVRHRRRVPRITRMRHAPIRLRLRQRPPALVVRVTGPHFRVRRPPRIRRLAHLRQG